MTPETAPGPSSWPELVARWAGPYRESLATFDDIPIRMSASRAGEPAGDRLGGYDATTSAVLVLSGPAAARPFLALVSAQLPRAIGELRPLRGADTAFAAWWTLSVVNAAECLGADVPEPVATLAPEWLPVLATRLDEFPDRERHALALACAAAGLPQRVRSFADDGVNATFTPGATFGFNVPAFAAHLASAITARADYPDVEPAWLEFVHNFPIKLDTDMLDWPALLWAARAVYATIGGIPVAEVGDELHRLVTGA
ncbi:MAG: hypothetical protein IT355_06150 [Gemmatimonadaceae bacterium]|nr:hypothetical protein [Gemmatimonadaceae bacterium]